MIKTQLFKFIPIILTTGILYGCGGGNDNDAPTVTLPPINTSTSIVSIDPSIPTITSSAIHEIISPFDSVSVGQTLPTPTAESMVFATDKNGQIRMAGFATANKNTPLTAESTALAIVRLTFNVGNNFSSQQLNQFIKELADFPQLVALTQDTLNKGTPLEESQELLTKVLLVAEQAAARLTAEMTKTPEQAVSFLNINTGIKEPTPLFTIISGGLSSVKIDANRQLSNSMPIAWNVKTYDYDNELLDNKLLEASGIISRFYQPTTKVINSDHGKSFSLVVNQDEESMDKNIMTLLIDGVSMALSLAGVNCDDACMMKPFYQNAGLGLSIGVFIKNADYSATAIADFVAENVPSMVVSVMHYMTEKQANAALRRYSETAFIFLKKITILESAEKMIVAGQGVLFTEKIALVALNSKKKEELTVCISSTDLIVNCAARFQIARDSLVMVAGDEFNYNLRAFDLNQQYTLLPTDESLTITPNATNNFTIDTTNKKLYAKKASEMGGVTVRDTTTNVNTTQVIPVIEPVFQKDLLTIKVGEKAIVNMVDILGRNFSTVKNTDLYTITSSSPDSIKVTPTNQAKLAWQIEGLKPNNEIKLVAKNKVTGTESFMLLNVTCPTDNTNSCEDTYLFSFYPDENGNTWVDDDVIITATKKDGRIINLYSDNDGIASGLYNFTANLSAGDKITTQAIDVPGGCLFFSGFKLINQRTKEEIQGPPMVKHDCSGTPANTIFVNHEVIIR